ncbi:hypothetical protein [Reyranella sp.]|uniref:hypothetical protein n=1 Tax=Reyranella sp. TaxID=1929291 RepID=UPI003D0FF6D2
MSKLLSVKELHMKIAEAEGAKASAALKAQQAEEAEKKALLDHLLAPSGLTDEQASEKVSLIISRAMENGLTAVQVLRFPNHICTDGGRAINQVEEGWEKTLTGLPKEMYGFWKRELRPLGYHIRYHIIDYPGGMPGDVAITLSWG